MKYALVGYGRMGKAIEEVAGRRGHELVAVVDPVATGPLARPSLGADSPGGAEVAFEFTTPPVAEANVVALLEAGVSVACGTTGWDVGSRKVLRAAESTGVVVAPNFSVGMNLFYRVVEEASRMALATGLYDPFVFEAHHRGKVDAPSGTAGKLASILREAGPAGAGVEIGCTEGRPVAPGAVHVASIRAGHEPGSHTVGFDGEHDLIQLTHRARGRSGFALGAVLAAEWIRGRKGLYGFDRVLEDLLEKGGRP